ncbi:hypothetical protein N7471_013329 [Penicillium samsonianum]|uniref:uncharacterized protein n=1 Tax=Penicillium samsonianum TaxID=1882272 RepID=UPI0025491407|nr:uncharacterized protein N7471_013329 [Penicillium samsonianum]KAJ6118709.1 hypothetical protein N7471_013329 [Penicillium samsonianum]
MEGSKPGGRQQNLFPKSLKEIVKLTEPVPSSWKTVERVNEHVEHDPTNKKNAYVTWQQGTQDTSGPVPGGWITWIVFGRIKGFTLGADCWNPHWDGVCLGYLSPSGEVCGHHQFYLLITHHPTRLGPQVSSLALTSLYFVYGGSASIVCQANPDDQLLVFDPGPPSACVGWYEAGAFWELPLDT